VRVNTRFKGRRAFAICATLAIQTGCGAPLAPAPRDFAMQATSWVNPEARAQNLLYVSDIGTNAVDILSYPAGKRVGSLYGFGSVAGLCADKSGDVFVVDEAGPVQVFAHGGMSPIRKLTTTGAPYGCAIDPTTGNLALTNLSSYSNGAIAVYPKAKGKPKEYNNKNVIDATFFCGYDGSGNLFASGWNRSADPILVTLPKKSGSLGYFKLYESNPNPSGVQWDGKYVALGARGKGVIYRVDGSNGATKGTITLKKGTDVEQFWIQGTTLIGPNWTVNGTVPYWRYPSGGAPTKTLSGFTEPLGATVSLAK
jgi:hypothetical protein